MRAYRDDGPIPSGVLETLDELARRTRSVKDTLILANQALVVSIAKRHVQSGLTLEELTSEGTTPLLKSIEKFDYTKGYKFSTYVSWAIMRHFARTVPQYGQRRQQYQSHTQDELDRLAGGVMDVDQDEAYRRSMAVQDALAALDDREKHILTNRFRLDRKSEPMSLAQLGRSFGISKERVRQIEARAMTKMHGMLKKILATNSA